MPSWKNTGLFRRREEENTWEARRRLTIITAEHNLDQAHPISHPPGAVLATVVGYVAYVAIFVISLDLSLSIFAGSDGYDSLLTWQRWPMLLLLAVLAVMITTAVARVMLKIHSLQSGSNGLLVFSLVLALVVVLYMVWAEGFGWVMSIFVVSAFYAFLWQFLYFRAVDVLYEPQPAAWEFF